MSEHSRWLSPSSIGRRILCPGSAYLEAELPDDSGPAAARGTACHKLAEDMVVRGVDPVGRIGAEIIPGVRCDADMAEAAAIAGSAALELLESVADGATVQTELRLPEINGCFGTADLVVDELFGTLTVADYKFGQVLIEPDADQLKTYAVLAASDALDTYQAINLAIIQPGRNEPVSRNVMTPAELAKWRDEVLLPTIAAVNSGTAKRCASPEACRYCRAASAGVCPEYNQAALAIAQADFRGVITEPAITDDLVNALYPQLPLLEKWITTVKQRAREMAATGNLAGHKLVAGRSSRTWRDEALAAEEIHAAGHDPYERKIISPAKAEKLGKEVKESIKHLILKTTGEPIIAPEDSPKPAIPPITTAREDFATETTHAS